MAESCCRLAPGIFLTPYKNIWPVHFCMKCNVALLQRCASATLRPLYIFVWALHFLWTFFRRQRMTHEAWDKRVRVRMRKNTYGPGESPPASHTGRQPTQRQGRGLGVWDDILWHLISDVLVQPTVMNCPAGQDAVHSAGRHDAG